MSRREHLLRLARGLAARADELSACVEASREGPGVSRTMALIAELAETRRARAELLAELERFDACTLDQETAS